MFINHDEIGYTLEELKEALAICGEDAECAACPFREACDEDETFVYRAALDIIEEQCEDIRRQRHLITYMEVSLADALDSVKDAVETVDAYEDRIEKLEKENAMLLEQSHPLVRKAVSVYVDGDSIFDMIKNMGNE